MPTLRRSPTMPGGHSGRSDPVLSLSDEEGPLFVRLARGIAADIRRGRLAPGQRLPGSRRIADQLEIHRNTVLAALRELEQEGWVESRTRQGTYVAEALPREALDQVESKQSHEESVLLDLPEAPPEQPFHLKPGVLPLVGGLPDLRLLRREELTRAFRRAVLQSRQTLSYGSERGSLHLRRALVQLLANERGIRTDEDEVLITRGSQMGLFLSGQALLRPGDTVIVEEWGYPPAWEAFRLARANLVPVRVDAAGIDVDEIERLAKKTRISAVYVTPHHQYPTTVTMSQSRRLSLVRLARAHGFAIIEDDYDFDFRYAGRPVLPLASAERDVVVYLGTLSKVYAPGLRVGYAVASRRIVEHMARIRTYVDRQGDLPLEEALSHMIEEDELLRHARRMRRHYQERRDALDEALRRELAERLSFRVPLGGLAFWTKVRGRSSADAWAQRAAERGVLVQPGRRYRFDGLPSPHLRLGFGALTPQEIRRAVRLLASAWAA